MKVQSKTGHRDEHEDKEAILPILAIFTGEISKDNYEALRNEVKWETDHAPGGLFHAAAFDESGGLHVADVWESPEAMNVFVEQRLMPAIQKLGLAPPNAAVYPAHNVNAYPALDKHRI